MAEVLNQGYKKGKAKKKIKTDTDAEGNLIEDAASKKSLYGLLGSSVGQLAIMGLTGGTINPVTLALLTGATNYATRKAGEKLAGDMPTDLEYLQEESDNLDDKISGGGLTESIMAGVTAGVGQKLKLMKDASSKAQLLNEANRVNIPKNLSQLEKATSLIPDNITEVKGAPPGGVMDSISKGKLIDVTNDNSTNILDIIASQSPKPGGSKAKDLYESSKLRSLGNKGAKSPIQSSIQFLQNIASSRSQDK